jgi:hypothetical protein
VFCIIISVFVFGVVEESQQVVIGTLSTYSSHTVMIAFTMFAVHSTYWSVIATFSSLLRWVWSIKYWLHLLNHIIDWSHSCDMGINSSTSSHAFPVPVPPSFSQSWLVTTTTTGTAVKTRKTENVKMFLATRRMSAFDRFYFPSTSVLVACFTAGAECAGEIRILLVNLVVTN